MPRYGPKIDLATRFFYLLGRELLALSKPIQGVLLTVLHLPIKIFRKACTS